MAVHQSIVITITTLCVYAKRLLTDSSFSPAMNGHVLFVWVCISDLIVLG